MMGVFPSPAGKKGRSWVAPPRFLSDMRRVYSQAEERDQGEGQKAFRRLFKEDPIGFVTQLRQAEQAYGRTKELKQGKVKSDEPAVPEEKDEGVERVEELIERLLREAQP